VSIGRWTHTCLTSRLHVVLACATVILVLSSAGVAEAQLGRLVAPGPLAKAHASLEGVANCQKCHESGKGISADRCLTCHKTVADRMAAKRGVHGNLTKGCVSCHPEHAGVDADMRHLDTAKFNHATQTDFALEGKHAEVARTCEKCHKTRSFLKAQTTCSGCHSDVHKPTLGAKCDTCHSTSVTFKETRTRYDHAKAAYPLAGAHQRVECVKCHANKVYTGLKFAVCSDCHKDPHQQKFTGACATCHTPEAWKTQKIDHAKTPFPLNGRHADVKCASCHTEPPVKVKLKADRCAACHADVHRAEFKQDCTTCHTEQGWRQVKFDHQAKTKSAYALTGKHATAECVACHKGVKLTATPPAGTRASAPKTTGRALVLDAVDFRGLTTPCASCHADVHRAELGSRCETCHTTAGFRLPAYTHPRLPEFFAGQHAGVSCERCHGPQTDSRPKPEGTAAARPQAGPAPQASLPYGKRIEGWKFKNVSTACATCHRDVHLAQEGTACETCHAIAAAKFAVVGFSHAKAKFALTGKHQDAACAKCHKSETGAFPGGRGTAVRLKGVATTCQSCHEDKHLGQLGKTCETCHTSASFKIASYKHAEKPEKAGFFVAKHASAKCQACHKEQEGAFPAGRGTTVRYKGFGTACATCHADQDKHRGALGTTCSTCHTASQWGVVSRAFHKTGAFPLEGRHLSVECASCHANGVIKGTPTRCYECHWVRRQDDRYRTRLGNDCETCHRTMSWVAVNWNHETKTGVRLSPVHRALGCESCHQSQDFSAPGVSCDSCHQRDYQGAANPNHASAGFPTNCDLCHRTYQSSWQQAVFSHNAGFALSGTHAAQPCAACHKDGVYQGKPSDCYSCHKADYDRSQNPNHAAAGYPTTCDSCHRASDASFTASGAFNHNSTFELFGVHTTQPCAACHKNNVYKGTPRDCYPCHQADFQRAQNPNHVSAGFSTACESCHRPNASDFKGGATFNHNASFQLIGMHAAQDCTACHKTGVYKGTARDCFGCHQADYQKAQNPNHVAAALPTTCDACHKASDASFSGTTTFTHGTFQLVGLHATQACAACHKNNVYKGTPRDCFSCHQAVYQSAQSPNHVTAGYSTACDSCHKATDPSFKGFATANHATFQLVGLHATLTCTSCHRNNVYKGTPRDCYTCHQANYAQTKNPSHSAAGFGTTCDSCHKATDPTWLLATVTHSTFPLAGLHATQACAACHKNGVYKGTPRDCYTCHQANYAATSNPNHGAAGFGTTCDSCHKATDPTWLLATVSHTTYPLVGLHATQACAACHKNNVYKGTPRDCFSCHQATYAATKNPSHTTAGYPTTCDSCHKATDPTWLLATVSHTSYPLVGVHATQACAACHKNGVYLGTPRDCFSCHQANYTATANPNHAAAGYPTTCDSCHKNTDPTWLLATVNHTTYPLVGLHATQACAACHKNGVYKGTSRLCYTCHQANYTATTNPNHTAAGYPTTCDSCHKATDPTWLLATVNHTTYPLVGVHATQPCAACHKNGVYLGTSRLCSSCHQANYAATTNPNHTAAGYPTTCDSCHKATDATWLLATVNHTTYPLVGLHATLVCAACHKNNVYLGTPRVCYSCHQTNYTQTTNPNHVGAGFSTACDSCHKATDPTWLLAVFNHTYFPITSGRHNAPCSQCHTDPTTYAVFNCLGCHARASIDSSHASRAGYRYDSAACYSCHPRGSAG
jgi:hypothetical protein